MGTEIFQIDASWAEKLTKARVQFLFICAALTEYWEWWEAGLAQRCTKPWQGAIELHWTSNIGTGMSVQYTECQWHQFEFGDIFTLFAF